MISLLQLSNLCSFAVTLRASAPVGCTSMEKAELAESVVISYEELVAEHSDLSDKVQKVSGQAARCLHLQCCRRQKGQPSCVGAWELTSRIDFNVRRQLGQPSTGTARQVLVFRCQVWYAITFVVRIGTSNEFIAHDTITVVEGVRRRGPGHPSGVRRARLH